MNQYMDRAVELARKNVEEGGQPFGAVIERNGEVLGEGVNELHLQNDASGHAEMIAVRKVEEKLGRLDLSDCTMYASGEPCPMCYAMMRYAGIQDIYFAESKEEAQKTGLSKGGEINEELQKPEEMRKVRMKHLPLEKEGAMALFRRKNG